MASYAFSAMRLLEAGVSMQLHSFPGTFRRSSAVTGAGVTRRELEERYVALRRGLAVR